MSKKEYIPQPLKCRGWIVLFLLLWAVGAAAQQKTTVKTVKKTTLTTVTTKKPTTGTPKKTTTGTTKTTTAAKKASPKPPVDVRQAPEPEPDWLLEQKDQPDSLQIKLIEVPTAIPTKVDSLLKAHSNNRLARRLDSLLQIDEHRERMLRHMQRIARFDSMMTARYAKINTDKNYVIRPPERITFKITMSSLGTSLATDGKTDDGSRARTRLTADFKNSMNFSATYRSISIGGSLDPTRIFRKNEDVEFNLISYGNRFGGDAVFQRANSFHGHANMGNERYDITSGAIHQKMLAANLYYVFKYRTFSYAAAFSQSFLQKRSAGSLLVGASLIYRKTHGSYDLNGEPIDLNLHAKNIGIGAGYGYNWVPHRRWLIHLSALPTLMLYNKNERRINGESSTTPHRFTQFIATGRSALVYSFHNMFVGGTAVWTRSSFGSSKDLEITTLRWQAQVFWGARLWK